LTFGKLAQCRGFLRFNAITDSEAVEAPPEAMKQTRAEPLDCFVRQPGVLRRAISGVSVSVRPAAGSWWENSYMVRGARRPRPAFGHSGRSPWLLGVRMRSRASSGRQFTRGWALSSQRTKGPNKAPEPTRAAVTPRAMVRYSECPKRNVKRIAARVAPAARVAHL
jgi:hypothetical protein